MAQSDVIREFLVKLGFRVDQKGLNDFTEGVENATKITGNLILKLAEIGGAVAASTMIFAKGMEDLYFSAKRTGSQADSLKAFGEAARNFGVDTGEAASNVESFAAKLRNQPGFESWLQSMGVNTRSNGALKDTTSLMAELGDSLQKYDPYIRRQMADQAGFSEKMLLALSDPRFAAEMSKYREVYKDSGLQKAAQDAHEFDIKLRGLSETLKANLAPTMTWLVGVFKDGIEGGDTWFKKHSGEINQWKDSLGGGLKAILTDVGGMIGTLSGALSFYIDKIVEYSTRAQSAISKIIPDSWKKPEAMASFGERFGWMGAGLSFTDEELGALKPKGGGVSSPGASSASTESMIDAFMKYGWTRAQAAGIVANLKHESGSFNPGEVGDGGKAYGIGQWHPDRQAAFRRFAGKDIRQSTRDEQIAFVNHELTMGEDAGARRAGMLLNANKNNAYMAGDVMSRYYERPLRTDAEASSRGAMAAQIVQTNNINITGVADAQSVGREVKNGMSQANADITRNMKTAVQ